MITRHRLCFFFSLLSYWVGASQQGWIGNTLHVLFVLARFQMRNNKISNKQRSITQNKPHLVTISSHMDFLSFIGRHNSVYSHK
ncbi:hypothetical protein J3E68DRAFT_361515 [Trichoderma sp. SZMC 28012]